MPGTFQQGWQFFAKAAQAGLSANAGQNYYHHFGGNMCKMHYFCIEKPLKHVGK